MVKKMSSGRLSKESSRKCSETSTNPCPKLNLRLTNNSISEKIKMEEEAFEKYLNNNDSGKQLLESDTSASSIRKAVVAGLMTIETSRT